MPADRDRVAEPAREQRRVAATDASVPAVLALQRAAGNRAVAMLARTVQFVDQHGTVEIARATPAQLQGVLDRLGHNDVAQRLLMPAAVRLSHSSTLHSFKTDETFRSKVVALTMEQYGAEAARRWRALGAVLTDEQLARFALLDRLMQEEWAAGTGSKPFGNQIEDLVDRCARSPTVDMPSLTRELQHKLDYKDEPSEVFKNSGALLQGKEGELFGLVGELKTLLDLGPSALRSGTKAESSREYDIDIGGNASTQEVDVTFVTAGGTRVFVEVAASVSKLHGKLGADGSAQRQRYEALLAAQPGATLAYAVGGLRNWYELFDGEAESIAAKLARPEIDRSLLFGSELLSPRELTNARTTIEPVLDGRRRGPAEIMLAGRIKAGTIPLARVARTSRRELLAEMPVHGARGGRPKRKPGAWARDIRAAYEDYLEGPDTAPEEEFEEVEEREPLDEEERQWEAIFGPH